jgi:hypothetical protein
MSAPTTKRCAVLAALALGLSLGAGCGDAAEPLSADGTATTADAPSHYLPAAGLRRELANGVRAGLYRLAVMSQPPDDAADLGQQLPTGTVAGVRCGAAATLPIGSREPWRWACRVTWQTADGAARLTRYDVRLLPNGCFAAGAVPRYPAHRDTTIASYAEHPLNAIASARRGC